MDLKDLLSEAAIGRKWSQQLPGTPAGHFPIPITAKCQPHSAVRPLAVAHVFYLFIHLFLRLEEIFCI